MRTLKLLNEIDKQIDIRLNQLVNVCQYISDENEKEKRQLMCELISASRLDLYVEYYLHVIKNAKINPYSI